MFPNPVTDDVAHLKFLEMKPGIYKLSIYDQQGRVVLKTEVHVETYNQNKSLNLSGIAKGRYVICITENKNMTIKTDILIQ